MENMDPVLMEVYRNRFAGISEEMGVTLQRTSYSPNIKERLDFSCAIFDAAGLMIAQAAHIPVHLGAMPDSVEAALAAFSEWQDGDVVMLNDPFEGGTHLPDVTLVSPVFVDAGSDGPAFFIASRAHHADIGGMTPGSLPLSTEIFQEGLIIPPVKLYRAGVLNADLLKLVLRNVRTSEERKGDLAAQRAAHAVGDRRLREMAGRHGIEQVLLYANFLQAYSKRMVEAAIASWPDGVYSFVDYLELDAGASSNEVAVHVTVTIKGNALQFDFAGTAESTASSLNAVLSITKSACYYVVASLMDEEVPINSGCFAPVKVSAPAGCLVNAQSPAAVAGGNVETSQRIVDAAFGALSDALPDNVPAASQGTMNNLTIGGKDLQGKPFAYYETIAGGMGATAYADGLDGVHVHMSNTLNTPVETMEMVFPFRIVQYGLRTDSAGAGKFSGGQGVVREYAFLAEVTATVLSERRTRQPWGLNFGAAGASGRNTLVDKDGYEEALPSKFSRRFLPGERLRIETPGGGGWGAVVPEE
ncbi:MAG: hydantoinase B/oxoprolinase family protein [Rhodothermales bacterium]